MSFGVLAASKGLPRFFLHTKTRKTRQMAILYQGTVSFRCDRDSVFPSRGACLSGCSGKEVIDPF